MLLSSHIHDEALNSNSVDQSHTGLKRSVHNELSYIDNSNFHENIIISNKDVCYKEDSGIEENKIDYTISSGLGKRYQKVVAKWNNSSNSKLSKIRTKLI